MTRDVLALIDEALADYTVSDDAMRSGAPADDYEDAPWTNFAGTYYSLDNTFLLPVFWSSSDLIYNLVTIAPPTGPPFTHISLVEPRRPAPHFTVTVRPAPAYVKPEINVKPEEVWMPLAPVGYGSDIPDGFWDQFKHQRMTRR